MTFTGLSNAMIRLVASLPSITGITMSISTTSTSLLAQNSTASFAVLSLADRFNPVEAVEVVAQSEANQRMVVDNQYTDRF